MKITKFLCIFMLLFSLIPCLTGCLDFAQRKGEIDHQLPKTEFDGGITYTIIIKGIAIDETGPVVSDILKQIEIAEENK